MLSNRFKIIFFFFFLSWIVTTINSQENDKAFDYSDKIFINYVEKGTGNIPIIFLHGFGVSLKSWYDIINYFDTNKYKIFLIDLKGFGKSSTIKDGKYSTLDQSKIISKFIEEKKLENLIIISHSYGGGVALLTTLYFQENKKDSLISKLILLDCAAYKGKTPFFIGFLKVPILNKLILNLTSDKFRASYILNRIFFDKKKIKKKITDRYIEAFRGKGKNYTFIKSAKEIIPENYENIIYNYKSITTPSLIIWGENDKVIPLRFGIKLNEELPNSELVIIKKCGHAPHEELPEITFNIINDYISK